MFGRFACLYLCISLMSLGCAEHGESGDLPPIILDLPGEGAIRVDLTACALPIEWRTPSEICVYHPMFDGFETAYVDHFTHLLLSGELEVHDVPVGREIKSKEAIITVTNNGIIHWDTIAVYERERSSEPHPLSTLKTKPDSAALCSVAMEFVRQHRLVDGSIRAKVTTERLTEVLNPGTGEVEVRYDEFTVSIVPQIDGIDVIGDNARLDVCMSPSLLVDRLVIHFMPWKKDVERFPCQGPIDALRCFPVQESLVPAQFAAAKPGFDGLLYYASGSPLNLIQPVYRIVYAGADVSFSVFVPVIAPGHYKASRTVAFADD